MWKQYIYPEDYTSRLYNLSRNFCERQAEASQADEGTTYVQDSRKKVPVDLKFEPASNNVHLRKKLIRKSQGNTAKFITDHLPEIYLGKLLPLCYGLYDWSKNH